MTTGENQSVKIARMEERMKNVEGQLTDFRKEVLIRLDGLQTMIQTDGTVYATKADLLKVEKLATRTRWIDGIVVSTVTAALTFLLYYFLQNVAR
jgi:hypothetical protein